jgi:hypothetical protein
MAGGILVPFFGHVLSFSVRKFEAAPQQEAKVYDRPFGFLPYPAYLNYMSRGKDCQKNAFLATHSQSQRGPIPSSDLGATDRSPLPRSLEWKPVPIGDGIRKGLTFLLPFSLQ